MWDEGACEWPEGGKLVVSHVPGAPRQPPSSASSYRPHLPEWKVILTRPGTTSWSEPALHLFNEAAARFERGASAPAPSEAVAALSGSAFGRLPPEVLARVAHWVLVVPISWNNAWNAHGELVRRNVPGDPLLRFSCPFTHQMGVAHLCAFAQTCRAFRDCVDSEAPALRLESAARLCSCLPARLENAPHPFVAQLERAYASTVELALLASALFQIPKHASTEQCEDAREVFNAMWRESAFAEVPIARRALRGRIGRISVAHRGPASLQGASSAGALVLESRGDARLLHVAAEEPDVFSPVSEFRVRSRTAWRPNVACADALDDFVVLLWLDARRNELDPDAANAANAADAADAPRAQQVQIWRASTGEFVGALPTALRSDRQGLVWLRRTPGHPERLQVHAWGQEHHSDPRLDGPRTQVKTQCVECWRLDPDGAFERVRSAVLQPGSDGLLNDTTKQWLDSSTTRYDLRLEHGCNVLSHALARGSGCLALSCMRRVLRPPPYPSVMQRPRFLQRVAVLDPDDGEFHLVMNPSREIEDVETARAMTLQFVALSNDGSTLLFWPKLMAHPDDPLSIYKRLPGTGPRGHQPARWIRIATLQSVVRAMRAHVRPQHDLSSGGAWSPCGKYYLQVYSKGVLTFDVHEAINRRRNTKRDSACFEFIRAHPGLRIVGLAWSNGFWVQTQTGGVLHIGLRAP